MTSGGIVADHVLKLISQEKLEEIPEFFKQVANDPEIPDSFKLKQVIQTVTTVLKGSRDPEVADDPSFDPLDAAEILFLIERLNKLNKGDRQPPSI